MNLHPCIVLFAEKNWFRKNAKLSAAVKCASIELFTIALNFKNHTIFYEQQ